MTLNCVATAGYLLYMRGRIKLLGFKDLDSMLFNNLLSIPILVVASVLFEDWGAESLARNFPEEGRWFLLFAMAFSGAATVGISYTTAWCIRVTSSTTYSMVGALNSEVLLVCPAPPDTPSEIPIRPSSLFNGLIPNGLQPLSRPTPPSTFYLADLPLPKPAELPVAASGFLFFGDAATFSSVGSVLVGFLAGLVYSSAKNAQAAEARAKTASQGEIPLHESRRDVKA